MWERLGEIEPVKGTSPRLIETVTPDVQKAIQDAKGEINFAEDVEQVNFYSKALGLLLWVLDGPSGSTRNRVPKLVNYEEENDPEIDMGKFQKGRRATLRVDTVESATAYRRRRQPCLV